MENDICCLSDEGFPWLLLTRDGKFINKNNGLVYKTYGNNAQIFHHRDENNKRVYIHLFIPRLIAKYFGCELDEVPNSQKKCLDVLGFPDYWVTKDGRIWSYQSVRYLSPTRDNKGYLSIGLNDITGKICTKKVHRLVALSFIPNPEGKEQVNHINGLKDDNRVENLEWVTNQENKDHAVEHRLHKHRYSDDDAHAVCLMIDSGYSNREISESTGISPDMVNYIRHGGYAHIGRMYKYFHAISNPKAKTIGRRVGDNTMHNCLN